MPAHTNTVMTSVSSGSRMPSANAATVGATPNDTRSASESSSWPSMLLDRRHRAILPSR